MIWASKQFTETESQGVSPQVAATYLQCCVSNQIDPTPKHDFAPRFGFDLARRGTEKLVVRGGAGYFFDTLSYNFNFYDLNENVLLTKASNPNYPQPTGMESAPPLPLQRLWLPAITTNSFAAFAANPRGFQPFKFYDYPGNKDPNSLQWSLGTEYSVTPALVADISYVGSHGVHLPIRLFFNQVFPACSGRRSLQRLHQRAAGASRKSVPDRSQLSFLRGTVHLTQTSATGCRERPIILLPTMTHSKCELRNGCHEA